MTRYNVHTQPGHPSCVGHVECWLDDEEPQSKEHPHVPLGARVFSEIYGRGEVIDHDGCRSNLVRWERRGQADEWLGGENLHVTELPPIIRYRRQRYIHGEPR